MPGLKLIHVDERGPRCLIQQNTYLTPKPETPQMLQGSPDNKVHGTIMGPTWALSAPDGPHVGPMNLAIRGVEVSWAMYFWEHGG